MLLYYGKPNAGKPADDEGADRAARIEALRDNFYRWKNWAEFAPNRFKPVAIRWLQLQMEKEGHPGLKDYGADARVLVLNAHGNEFAFNDLSTGARQLADLLIKLGLREAGTQEIWLASCNNGRQTQDNSRPAPIAAELRGELSSRHGLKNLKIYAPRGFLSFLGGPEDPIPEGTVIRYTSVVAEVDEEGKLDSKGVLVPHAYPFDKGAWVLANI